MGIWSESHVHTEQACADAKLFLPGLSLLHNTYFHPLIPASQSLGLQGTSRTPASGGEGTLGEYADPDTRKSQLVDAFTREMAK